jgi:antitoxin (DNA-binding transcriptional repressor) of toxin-antitoxin stability system
MAEVVSMHQAKSNLSKLVQRAKAGETILLGAYGQIEARLVPPEPDRSKKRIGILAGKLVVPDDFDAPLPEEVLAGFEGEGT